MPINIKDKLVTVEGVKTVFDIEAGNREQADLATNLRIDNIVAPDGDASLSEVVDARLSGLSGTLYSTLKDRIDADTNNLSTLISNIINKFLPLSISFVNSLPDETNIDTIKYPSIFRVTTGEHAATMLGDVPFTSSPYSLITFEITQQYSCLQIAIAKTRQLIKYRRYLGDDIWTDWYSIARIEDVEDYVNTTLTPISSNLHTLKSKFDNLSEVRFSDTNAFAVGTIHGNNGTNVESTTRIRTTYLPDSVIGLVIPTGFSIAVYAYNNGQYIGVWDGENFIQTTHNMIWLTGDIIISDFETNSSLRVVLRKNDNSQIIPSDASDFLFVKDRIDDIVTTFNNKIGNTPLKLRIMQYNLGKFNMGQSLSGTYRFLNSSNLSEIVNNYREFLGEIHPDIIGSEEYQGELTIGVAEGESQQTINTEQLIFDRLYPYKDVTTALQSKRAVLSKYNFIDTSHQRVYFTYLNNGVEETDSIWCVYSHILIGNRVIAVVATAFPSNIGELQIAKRAAAFPEVLSLLQNDEYAFLICDGNYAGMVADMGIDSGIEEGTDIYNNIIVPAGFNSVMGSYFKWDSSWKSKTTGHHGCPDNIYYRDNGKIQLVDFHSLFELRENETLASDHAPIYADFLIL